MITKKEWDALLLKAKREVSGGASKKLLVFTNKQK